MGILVCYLIKFVLIYSIQKMLKQKKVNEPLKLHSYKIDSSQIQSKINELDQLKADLQSTLSRHKSQESLWAKEIGNLRSQNEKLKKDISSLQFTKKSQSMLIEQLQRKLQHSQNQLFNSHIQLENEVKHRQSLVAQYESRIMDEQSKMINSISQYQNYIKNEAKDVQTTHNKLQSPTKENIYSENSISGSETSIPYQTRKVKRVKKVVDQPQRQARKSVELREKYKINNVILQKQEESNLTDEDIYLEMIRVLYKQLTKIDIKSKDLFKIPAIDSFSQVKNPTINDIQRLLANYPFQVREQHKVKMIYNFIEKQLQRRGHQQTGMEIVQSIMISLSEIQGEKQMSLASGSSLAFYSESEMMMSSNLGSGILRRVSKPHIATAMEYCPDISQGTIQEEESMSERSNYL